MKVSKEQQELNRTALVGAASRLFRREGIDAVGVKEIAHEAGLTHGALYAHFSSKDELAAEAFDKGFREGLSHLENAAAAGADIPATFLDLYIGKANGPDDLEKRCPMLASTCELGRQGMEMSEKVLVSQRRLHELLSVEGPGGLDPAVADLLLAASVGAAAISFGMQKASPRRAAAFAGGVRAKLQELVDSHQAASAKARTTKRR
ncbi:TetR/AcrR family transcriptional regulator [Roseateles chitinivorans]|uniref:TetR/AcrR family transcriptional regulator n=1 Tax=Roseateles chitinivorans TaxID=2917965 RepID=UPI003D666F39